MPRPSPRLLNAIWLTVAIVIVACTGQKEPARKALAEAGAAIANIRDDANKFLPADLQGVEAAYGALKGRLDNGDYEAVLAGAPHIKGAVATLESAVKIRKSEAELALAVANTEWDALAIDVPKMIDLIQSRVDKLGGSKKLPHNISRDAYDSAKSGLDAMRASWTEANTEFASGNPVEAVAKARMVQEKGVEVLKLLGMS